MQLGSDLIPAKFIRRANRFLACVDLNGQETPVHIANSGRLRELFRPGAAVWLKPIPDPPPTGRKTAYDLALVETAGTLVSADARLPNALVAEAAAAGRLPGIPHPAMLRREAAYGESRLDLLLESPEGRTYIEVKSVTLVQQGIGLFPDSPTTRGAKHLNTLAGAVRDGHRAAVIFVIQRPDALAFAVNYPADPPLAAALDRAIAAGVDAQAYTCAVTPGEVRLARRIPIIPCPDSTAPERNL